MDSIALRTPRMLLRPLTASDGPEYVRVHVASQAFWAPWMPTDRPGESLEQTFGRRLADSQSGLDAGTACRLAGFLDDGRIAGFFGLSQIFRARFQNAYIGWSVSAEVARQGYATEGVAALLDYAFAPDGLGLHRVQANVIPENAPSMRLAEKLGFRREGLARRYLHIAGEWRDHVMYAKLADEQLNPVSI